MARAAKHVLALDFDGVVCDSCGESAISAWKAAAQLWPALFESDAVRARQPEILEQMRVVRPVVETGYENIVQIRALLEGVSTADILHSWHTVLPQKMEEWSLQRADMVKLFGDVRDAWMAEDLQGWLAPNVIYDGVASPIQAALADPSVEVYIVTTKQAHYTEILMDKMAGIKFPLDRIYSQTVSGRPKTEVLHMLQERHPDCDYHFVEDKMGTLVKVKQDSTLAKWHLYLVDWGYNTVEEQQQAGDDDRIALIDTAAFAKIAT